MTGPLAHPQVLVVGAGPTGLVLSLWLTRAGVRVRVVDRATEPGTTSRAMVIHARTLELYRQLGIDRVVIEGGLELKSGNLWLRGRQAARLPIGDMGAGISAFPYILVLPQDAHEHQLVEELARAGVFVERDTTLLGFEETTTGIRARLRTGDGAESSCEADYIAGCDGARSTVRDTIGVDFAGATYTGLFFVADLEADGPVVNGELHATLDDDDFLLVFSMREPGRVRLIGRVGADVQDDADLGWEDVRSRTAIQLGIDVHRVRWFSTYRVHHRVAGMFRRGRAFLLGDAAHIHSPVGGQGMNTGIGDAVNLAWKLAEVLHGRAGTALLDSYEDERIAFARTLVATTDRAFVAITSRTMLARQIALRVAPVLLPPLLRITAVRRAAFCLLSQTAITYRRSALSTGRAGGVRAGDRLPWIDARLGGEPESDNFAPLASRSWQVHVYGEATDELRALCAARGLPLHTFGWRGTMRRSGLQEGAVYLLRPDGYVGLADGRGTPDALERYLDARGIRPSVATAGAGAL